MLRYQRYWTLERLRGLVQVLQSLGFYEDDAWFLGPDVAQWPIHSALLQGDFSHPLSQTADGLSLLVEVHVLSPGRSGLKNRTYRRPFFPEKMEDVTVERLAQIYQERNQRRTRRKREPVDQPGFELAIGLVPGMEFWTPERLAWLVEVMKSFAHHDDAGGWCFGAEPQLIGPVRSVRPYYVDWMAAFDPTIVHIGGSANALKEVRSGNYKDADQFFNAAYFWRATDRYAPHNVYTSFAKLDELNKAKGYTSSTFTGFARKADQPSKKLDAKTININISYNLFNVRYNYDPGCNCYERYLAGEKHMDRESGHIKPKVVIAMKVPTHLGMEDGMREQMTTLGSGTAYVFQDGTVTIGTWNKKDKKDQIKFVNQAGDEITLDRGQTWISITAPEKSVTWQ